MSIPAIISEEYQTFLSYFPKFKDKLCIHGLQHVFQSHLHFLERLFWLVLFILAGYGAYAISSKQYERYVANPTVISLERDYRDWNGTLPAITICYHRRIDDSRAESLIKRLWNVDKNHAEFSYFMDFVTTVVYINNSYGRFNRFVNDKRLEFISMLTIAKESHPAINSIVSSFDTGAEFNMNEIITEKGICYTVNSILWPLLSST
jgi:Amiloride-sensitive sodium channel